MSLVVGVAAPSEVEKPSPDKPRSHGLVRVTNLRHWSFPDSTRIVVDVESEVSVHEGRLSNPDRIFCDLLDTQTTPELKHKSFAVGDQIVKQIRVAQTQVGVTRLAVDLNRSDVEHTIRVLTNPPRVAIELRRRGAPIATAPPPTKPAAMEVVPSPKEAPPGTAPPKGDVPATDRKPAEAAVTRRPGTSFPTAQGIAVGMDRTSLLAAFREPTLRTTTVEKRSLVEMYLYLDSRRNTATRVLLRDGRVISVQTTAY